MLTDMRAHVRRRRRRRRQQCSGYIYMCARVARARRGACGVCARDAARLGGEERTDASARRDAGDMISRLIILKYSPLCDGYM
jgi:hypothetical protein